MPNHCHNRVSFYGDSESEIQKLHDIFSKGLENDDNTETTGTVFGSFIPEQFGSGMNDPNTVPVVSVLSSFSIPLRNIECNFCMSLSLSE